MVNTLATVGFLSLIATPAFGQRVFENPANAWPYAWEHKNSFPGYSWENRRAELLRIIHSVEHELTSLIADNPGNSRVRFFALAGLARLGHTHKIWNGPTVRLRGARSFLFAAEHSAEWAWDRRYPLAPRRWEVSDYLHHAYQRNALVKLAQAECYAAAAAYSVEREKKR